MADRMFSMYSGGAGTVKTADDIARIIINQ